MLVRVKRVDQAKPASSLVSGLRSGAMARLGRLRESWYYRALADLAENDAPGLAAELAYRVFVALLPALLLAGALFSLLAPLWFGPHAQITLQREMGRDLPPDTARFILPYFTGLLLEHTGGLLTLGLVLTLWTISSAILTVMKAAVRILRLSEPRSYFARRGRALALTTYLPLLITLSLALTWFRTQVRALMLSLSITPGLLLPALRVGTAVLLGLIALALLFHAAVPTHLSRRVLLAGTLTTLGGSWLASELFALFARHVVHYGSTYGLLGGALGLVSWLYLSGFCLLAGLEIMALLLHRRSGPQSPPRK